MVQKNLATKGCCLQDNSPSNTFHGVFCIHISNVSLLLFGFSEKSLSDFVAWRMYGSISSLSYEHSVGGIVFVFVFIDQAQFRSFLDIWNTIG